ncbi:hypothetical protein ACWJJH_02580 [Endozoicomonadaceae bacterium StTr2]
MQLGIVVSHNHICRAHSGSEQNVNNKYNTHFILTHLIVLVIFGACLLMAGPMRGGLPVDGTLPERLDYIAANLFIWRTGWLVWMASALGLFLFATLLSTRIRPGAFRTFGLGLVALGIAPDLTAEVIYAFIIPLGIQAIYSPETLATLEQLAVHLTGFLGNGLYNLGGLVLTLLLIRQGLISRPIAVIGIIAWLLGLSLSVSILFNSMYWAEIFTAASMFLSTVWMLLIAYTLFRK